MDKSHRQAYNFNKWIELTDSDHGTRRAYYYGCRCEHCKRANKLYTQAYRILKTTGETWDDFRSRVYRGGKFPWEQ